MKQVYNTYHLGDMSAIYVRETDDNLVGLIMLPTSLENKLCLDGRWRIEPVVSAKFIGDPYPDGFSGGHSMKGSWGLGDFKFDRQTVRINGKLTQIITTHRRITSAPSEPLTPDIPAGKYPYGNFDIILRHVLEYEEGTDYVKSFSEIEILKGETVSTEMLSSYNICGFSCLEPGLRQEDFMLHRLQTKWSMEGKLESESFLDLQLEPAWIPIGTNSIRFGEVGSMPVRRYFPWMIAEDTKYGYSFGAQLAINSSWQMEVYNKDDRTSFSGGIADREFGHWVKILREGEVFTTPVATLTVACEDIDGISYRLTSAQTANLENAPEIEHDLPIIFNEYCTSWGNPTEESMLKIANALKGHGITYCVMDAGWHIKPGNDWSDIGDWIVNNTLFPNGLKYMADEIRKAGMIPGIWFEMENVGRAADMYKKTEYLLRRDGYPITACARRFLDMRKPEVIAFLDERVIDNLRENGFGYLKVDYNDNIGIGCEGAESLGEGLRQNMVCSREFFKRIREQLPDLVIENCSSGGHRLEPSMMSVASMASFSDAHEWTNIPVVAANVTRAILPAQSQIWAVLRAKDDEKRLVYSLANTFLGRMCLSGDIYDLSDWQWELVDNAIKLYKHAAPVIKNGRNFRYGEINKSYHHLKGWQAIIRLGLSAAGGILAVVHSFDENNKEIHIGLPEACMNSTYSKKEATVRTLCRKGVNVSYSAASGYISISGLEAMDGVVIVIK